VIELINQKIKIQDTKTKEIEKLFQKDMSLNSKDFIQQFMKERVMYHTY
jgi:hypothetical protein